MLTACGLPRGAAFQAEILGIASSAEGGDFAVFDVNSETLPIVAGWGAPEAELVAWPAAQEEPASLIIAPGDTLQLTIWDAEEQSLFDTAGVTALQPTEVNPRGRIFVPFIGELRVAGMSPTTARQRIEEELVRTVPSAQVQLTVEPGQGNTANLASGVGAPGLYVIPQRNFRILELFSLAGGPNPAFNSPQVRLVRDGRTFGIPYEEILVDPSRNIAVQGGDRIYMIDDERQFITLGATGSQSIFPFPAFDFSALEAMSSIGGVGGSANPEGVLIMREYAASEVGDGVTGPPQERVVFVIDLTSADGLFSAGKFLLQDNDLIYGTESALGPFLQALSLNNTLSTALN